MCTGRVDLAFIFRSFSNGMDGVYTAGCRLDECKYITQGNYHALNMVLLSKKIMEHIGLNPERLRVEFMSSAEGSRFAETVNDFIKKVGAIGPFGKSEGLDENGLKSKLNEIERLSSHQPFCVLCARVSMSEFNAEVNRWPSAN